MVSRFVATLDMDGPQLVNQMKDSAKGGLIHFWELFIVISCAPKIFETLISSLIEDI